MIFMRLETIIMYTMLKLEFFYMNFLKKNIFLTSNLDLKIETNQHFRQNDKKACNTRKKFDQNAQKNISNLHLEILIT